MRLMLVQVTKIPFEVSPLLGDYVAGTILEAQRLWSKVNRPIAMVKIPAILAVLEAITEVVALGTSVNATLIFSLDRYSQVISAYLAGLEKALSNGIDLSSKHPITSFFISRVDHEVNARLQRSVSCRNATLLDTAGVANARRAYKLWSDARLDPYLHSAISTLKGFLSKARLPALEALLRGVLEVEDDILDGHADLLNAAI
jgi:transaldolase